MPHVPALTSAPVLELSRAHPDLAAIRSSSEAGDYDAVADQLVALEDRDTRRASVAAGIVAGVDGAESWLERRLRSTPSDVVARTLLAHRQIVVGWEIRGSGRASGVSRAQFDDFHDWLRRAERNLIEVCAVEPEWALPWHVRLTSARGLELGQSEAQRRYARLAAICPDHYPAQSTLLQQLVPKWSGSWESAFEFARSCASAAPPGSPAHALVAEVHLERWLDLDDKEAAAYVRDGDVRDELLRAAQDSVWHPAYDPGFSAITQHSVLAALHGLAGRDEEAARHFVALGDFVDAWVWGYLGGHAARLEKIRKGALR